MTSLTVPHASARSSALDRAVLGLGSLITPFRRRKALNDLLELDDRMLRDIGLTRFDVQTMRRVW